MSEFSDEIYFIIINILFYKRCILNVNKLSWKKACVRSSLTLHLKRNKYILLAIKIVTLGKNAKNKVNKYIRTQDITVHQ